MAHPVTQRERGREGVRDEKHKTEKRTVFVAQLVERSPPTPEIRVRIQSSANFYRTFVYSQMC